MRQDAVRGSRRIAWKHKSFREECAEERRQEVEQIDDTDSPRIGARRTFCDLFHHFSPGFTIQPAELPNGSRGGAKNRLDPVGGVTSEHACAQYLFTISVTGNLSIRSCEETIP